MTTLERFSWQVFFEFLLPVVGVQLLLPTLALSGKLRGNNFGRFQCRAYLRTAWLVAQTNGLQFDVSHMPDPLQSGLRGLLIGGDWNFLIKTNFSFNQGRKEIVVVRQQPSEDVPRRLWNFYRRNPAHAAGYSDGTAGLIFPDEFGHLNLTGFIRLSYLVTNDSVRRR